MLNGSVLIVRFQERESELMCRYNYMYLVTEVHGLCYLICTNFYINFKVNMLI